MNTKLYTLLAFVAAVGALAVSYRLHLGELTVTLVGVVGALATALGKSLLPGGAS